MSNAHASRSFSDNEGEVSVGQPAEKVQKTVKKAPSAFRTISEVADDLDVQQHVLRFWETKFSQVRPLKRGGGRRYYRPEDVEILKRIHHLLYTEGYTIKGVQKLMKGQGKNQIIAESEVPAAKPAPQVVPAELSADPARKPRLNERQKDLLSGMLDDLKDIRGILRGE